MFCLAVSDFLKELPSIKTPKVYSLNSKQDCIEIQKFHVNSRGKIRIHINKINKVRLIYYVVTVCMLVFATLDKVKFNIRWISNLHFSAIFSRIMFKFED